MNPLSLRSTELSQGVSISQIEIKTYCFPQIMKANRIRDHVNLLEVMANLELRTCRTLRSKKCWLDRPLVRGLRRLLLLRLPYRRQTWTSGGRNFGVSLISNLDVLILSILFYSYKFLPTGYRNKNRRFIINMAITQKRLR